MTHKLPAELWLQIISIAASRRKRFHSAYSDSLFKLSRVEYPTSAYELAAISGFSVLNKAFRRLALPLLYEHLVFGNPYNIVNDAWRANCRSIRSAAWRRMSACKKRVQFLQTLPHLLIHVRKIEILSWSRTRPFVGIDCAREAYTTFLALERLVTALPSLCTLSIRDSPSTVDLRRIVDGLQGLQSLTLLPIWSGYGVPGLFPYCAPPLVPLQELDIDPGTLINPLHTAKFTSEDHPLYEFLCACSSSLRSLALYFRSGDPGEDDRYIPRRWPHMPVLNQLILECIEYYSPEIGESLAELLRSHPDIEFLHLDTVEPMVGDSSDRWAASWFQHLVSDPKVLPKLRSFSGLEHLNAESVVPGRPIETISIHFCPSLSLPHVWDTADSFTQYALSAATVTCLQFDVIVMTRIYAEMLSTIAVVLPNVEVFTWVGVRLQEPKLAQVCPFLAFTCKQGSNLIPLGHPSPIHE